MEKLGSWLQSLFSKVNVAPKYTSLLVFLVIVLASAYYICFPKIKFIHIPGRDFTFVLGHFRKCQLTFVNPTDVLNYGILTNYSEIKTNFTIAHQDVNKTDTALDIINPLPGGGSNGSTNKIMVAVNALDSEIKSVVVDYQPIELKVFYERYLKTPKAEYVRFRYIRKDLADFISRWNDLLSNWLLTFMCCGILVLITQLTILEIQTYPLN
jgi:hypothetical protein